MHVTLIDSPVANVANIARALRTAGASLEVTSDPVMRGTDGRPCCRHHGRRVPGLERARQAEEVNQDGSKEGYAKGTGRHEGERLEGRSDPCHEEGDEEGAEEGCEEGGEVRGRQAPDDAGSLLERARVDPEPVPHSASGGVSLGD